MDENAAYLDDFIEKRLEEVIDGELVVIYARPGTIHNFIVSNIYCLFANYLYGKKSEPLGGRLALYLDKNNCFMPDMMVICDPDKIQPDGVHGAPDLVVEVLSPSTVKNVRGRKMAAYARCGVREYWIVSPNERFVEVYRLQEGSFILYDIYVLHPDWQIAQMPDEERAAVVTHFKCSLFDDLEIFLEDIFYLSF